MDAAQQATRRIVFVPITPQRQPLRAEDFEALIAVLPYAPHDPKPRRRSYTALWVGIGITATFAALYGAVCLSVLAVSIAL